MSTTLTRGHASKNSWAPVKYTQTSLGAGTNAQGQIFPGGLDLTTPALRLQPGALRDALNFEVSPFGGYTRIEGYERFDGRLSPSAATYTIVQIYVAPAGGVLTTPFVLGGSIFGGSDVLDGGLDLSPGGFANIPSVGQIVTQEVSGATGTVIAVATTPVPYLVLTLVSGVFDDENELTIS